MNIKFKSKNYVIALLIIGILLLLSLALSGTYALWTITDKQTGSSKIIGGCLDFFMEDQSEGITFENTFPITDFEGMQTTGFNFTVTNNCSEPVDYRIDLDSLIEDNVNYISNEYVATLLDYGVKTTLAELEILENTDSSIREKHILAYDTVTGKSTNTHTLRLWVDESATTVEQNKSFLSQVSVIAGQGIEKYYTPEECFAFNYSMGTLVNYNVDCGGTDVVIPYQFYNENEEQLITTFEIAFGAFQNKGLTSVEFPRTVTKIHDLAFDSNPNLEKVIFKDGLISIGSGSFQNEDTKGILSSIMIPSTITQIDSSAFANNSLTNLVIPDNVLNVNAYAFQYNNLKNVSIGKEISKIQNETFAYNELENVILPDDGNLQTIGQRAFMENKLKKIIIPYSVTRINAYAFSNNPDLTIIIKRSDKTGMTFEIDWNGSASVTYDPDAV